MDLLTITVQTWVHQMLEASDNKGVIRKHISKRTDNTMAWPTVPNKKTKNDLLNTTQKTKDWATRTNNHRVCNKRNMMGVTIRTGTANPSRAPKFTSGC
jgi:hypothetical protein